MTALLSFSGVGVDKNKNKVLDAVSFTAGPGDVLVAFGRSGSGKHELLELSAGLSSPHRGEVRLSDPRPGRRLAVGYVMNEGGLINNMTLLDNALLPGVYHALAPKAELRARALELFKSFGIDGQAGLRPSQVGHSARRLAQLARALLVSPTLLVLDDPFDDVDAESARRIRRVLEGVRDEGQAAVLIAAGGLRLYLDWATRFLWVRGGGVEVFESREQLRASANEGVKVFLGEA